MLTLGLVLSGFELGLSDFGFPPFPTAVGEPPEAHPVPARAPRGAQGADAVHALPAVRAGNRELGNSRNWGSSERGGGAILGGNSRIFWGGISGFLEWFLDFGRNVSGLGWGGVEFLDFWGTFLNF